MNPIAATARNEHENCLQGLLFTLEPDTEARKAERFVINVFKVREILTMQALTRLPLSPEGFEGIVNIRGTTMPVLNLPKILNIGGEKEPDLLLVAEICSKHVALLVHGVESMIEVHTDAVVSAVEIFGESESEYASALVKLGDGVTATQLDVEAILAKFLHLEQDDDPSASGDGEGIRLSGTVLFADDSRMARGLIKSVFNEMGLDCIEAHDGQDAWERLESMSSHPPLALISDVEMPRLDGYALTRKVKADARFGAVPVVVYSSLSSEANVRMGRDCGADAYVAKFNRAGLREGLLTVLRGRAQTA